MKLCPSCSRHLRRDASTCPFCGAVIVPSAPTLAAFSLIAGLALGGCGDDGKDTTSESSTGTASGSSSSGAESTSTSTSTSTGITTSTSTSDSSEAGVSAYGGPPADTITAGDRALPAPDAEAPLGPLAVEPTPPARGR